MKIFKVTLPLGGNPTVFKLELPIGAKIISVQVQNLSPCMWYLFDESVSTQKKRNFRIVGTGTKFDETQDMKHLGSYILEKSGSVFHLFEM